MIKSILKKIIAPEKRLAIRHAMRVTERSAINFASLFLSRQGINLGAGDWAYIRWKGLDARSLATGRITEQTELPIRSNSLRYAYSSMFFEHIDDATAENLLREVFRCLKPRGVFRIVVPDFEKCLVAYRTGDHDFFDSVWGMTPRYENWLQHGVEPTLENKILYAFASYDNGIDLPDWQWPPWHYDPRYFAGPPSAEEKEVRQMALSLGSEKFSAYAVSKVPEDRRLTSMGHINAYTTEKLERLGKDAGYAAVIQRSFRDSACPVFVEDKFDLDKYKVLGAFFELQK